MDPNTLAHRGDPETSRDAAKNLSRTRTETVMRIVVGLLDQHGPMTPAELQAHYFEHREANDWPVIDSYSVRRRVSQMKRQVGVLRGVGRRDGAELLNLADNAVQAHADISEYMRKDAA